MEGYKEFYYVYRNEIRMELDYGVLVPKKEQ